MKKRIETILNTSHIEIGTIGADFVENKFTVKVTRDGRPVTGLTSHDFMFLRHNFLAEISQGVYKFRLKFTKKEIEKMEAYIKKLSESNYDLNTEKLWKELKTF